jgi:hypothetical protein
MQDNNFFDPEKIKLNNIKMIKVDINTPDTFESSGVTGFSLENSLTLSFDISEELAKADFKATIKSESKILNQEESIGNFHFLFIYKIENLEKLAVSGKKERLEVNSSLSNALSSITYSTARGILISRLQRTGLENFILPVINTNSLVVPN